MMARPRGVLPPGWPARAAEPGAAGRGTGRYARPPYSWTRVRAFQGAGSSSVCLPPAAWQTTVLRPPSSGRTSCHQTSPPMTVGKDSRRPLRATSAEEIGDGHAPKGISGFGAVAVAIEAVPLSAVPVPPSVIGISCPTTRALLAEMADPSREFRLPDVLTPA